jgi:hypothetical protein
MSEERKKDAKEKNPVQSQSKMLEIMQQQFATSFV